MAAAMVASSKACPEVAPVTFRPDEVKSHAPAVSSAVTPDRSTPSAPAANCARVSVRLVSVTGPISDRVLGAGSATNPDRTETGQQAKDVQ